MLAQRLPGSRIKNKKGEKKMKKYWLIMFLVFFVGLAFYVPEGKAFHGMGPVLKGPGYGSGSVALAPGKSLDRNEAKAMFDNYLKSQNNPYLKLGKIEEDGGFFKADVLNQDNNLVDIILIDKKTGDLRSEC
jgi:hypothetical protein